MGRSGWRSFGWAALAGVIVTAIVAIGQWRGWLSTLEGYLTDVRMRHANQFSPKISDDIVHVDIDDLALAKVGRWPWDREQLALAIDLLAELGPRTIVLDLLLDDPQRPRYMRDSYGSFQEIRDDDILAAAIKRDGNVLLGVSIDNKPPPNEDEAAAGSADAAAPKERASSTERADLDSASSDQLIVRWPVGVLRDAVAGVGYVNLGQADSSVRAIRIADDVEGQRFYQLGVVAAAHFLGLWPNGISATPSKLRIGDREEPLHDWRTLIPWHPRDPSEAVSWGEGKLQTWMRIHRQMSIWNLIALARQRQQQRELVGVLLTQNKPLDRDVTPRDLAEAKSNAEFFTGGADDASLDDQIHELEQSIQKDQDARQLAEDRLTLGHLLAAKELPKISEQFQTYQQRVSELRGLLEDKLVFIGWTGTGALADFYPTALGVHTPGVSVHAAIANGILTGHWIDQAPAWLDLLVTIIAGLSATLVASSLSPSRGWMAAVGLTGAYVAFNVVLVFDYGDMLLALGAPLVAAVGSWGTCTTIRAIQERREKAAIRRQFRARVSAQLVDFLTEHPDLVNMEGEERELTIAFTDFVGFTSISEKLEGRATVAMLNRYLRAMTEVMLDRSGYVNKFLGDGIMGFWGAPAVDTDHAAKACFAVLECYDALDMLNQAPEYEELPKLGMRVGISTGKVIVGDCGAPPRLNDYTVIGDAVNLAARLESANKMLGTRAMVTGRTIELMSERDRNRILWRPLGKLRVVGQTKLTEVFELVARADDPDVTDEIRDWIEKTREAVELFGRGEIEAARERWQELVLFERGAAGALLYTERCAELLESKREDYFLPLRSK